ncbi:MAG: hypothetical protein GY806_03000 [Gammaproteobacteria bacterium]|nr:hypothetical protein [Gammaproteobacteria bacterium]
MATTKPAIIVPGIDFKGFFDDSRNYMFRIQGIDIVLAGLPSSLHAVEKRDFLNAVQ